MPSQVGSTKLRDGTRVLTRHWEVDAPSPRAAVLIVHGLGEHCGRYEHVGDRFAAVGMAVFSWDLRGFGASEGERAYVDRWAQFHDDVEDRLAYVRATVASDLPVVLYGHSMGGLIALGYCVDDRPQPNLLVLSAPGIDDDLAAWKRAAAPILARFAPRLRIANGVRSSMLSRDRARQEAADHDPLMLGSSTTRFGALAFAAQPRVRAAIDRLAVPTLVIHGLDDPVVPARATEALGALPNVTRRTYPGVRHELHNEPEGPGVLDDVVAWIDAQLPILAGPRAGV
jgi:alpha-beta hydrolase superfamily lysophospholipase